ncbi:MAG: MsnO8 family LLM class oxidoreductase [Nitriliruptorales bacterium]|nr:MsnO8 family LLM class oxidoreductase [Nitriliruptorales bacterium]
MTVPLSILDLAEVNRGETAADALRFSTTLAQHAEQWGYRRVWYAEHHNIPAIASAATSVVIAHMAAGTTSIRLGAGGIMLPNHAPLVIAEQFGTLEALHPGRIDLGLGRAPGSDQRTFRALRRDVAAADSFPDDVLELNGYLTGETRVAGVQATPGQGSNVPLYILGSSLFGARVAAAFGLPYAFASHFAPQALQAAVTLYRQQFRPSDQLAEPYVITGMNVIAADSVEEARRQFMDAKRRRARVLFGHQGPLTRQQEDVLSSSPAVAEMLRYSAVGNTDQVIEQLAVFVEHSQADELMLVGAAPDKQAKLRSFELVARAYGLTRAA